MNKYKYYMAIVFNMDDTTERHLIRCEDMIDRVQRKFSNMYKAEIYKWRGDINDYRYICTLYTDKNFDISDSRKHRKGGYYVTHTVSKMD